MNVQLTPNPYATVAIVVCLYAVVMLVEMCIRRRRRRRSSELPVSAADVPPSTAAVAGIRTRLKSFPVDEADKDRPCGICLEPLCLAKVSAGQCGCGDNLFHTQCIAKWLARDRFKSCPVCRMPFVQRKNTQVAG